MKVKVYGDSLVDAADDLVEDQVKPAKVAVKRLSRMLLDGVSRRLSRVGAGHAADPGEPPFRQSGELLQSFTIAPTTARGNVVRGGIRSTLPYEHVYAVEYGWARGGKGKAKRALPRPFLRPSEAEVDAAVGSVLDEAFGGTVTR
jgi:hypothetical protein